jgi:glycosyltransferase involved in cell wall biosynthesis
MRILHVTPFHEHAVGMGGVALGTSSLARAQMRAGADVTIFATDVGLDRGANLLVDVNYRCFHVRQGMPFFMSGEMVRALAKHISDFDIVHIHGLWNVPVISAGELATRAGVPFALSPRGMLNQWAFRYRRWKKLPVWHLLQRRIVSNAACLIFTSEEERQQTNVLLRHRRTAVVPLGVEVGAANFEDIRRGGFRARLRIGDGAPLLVFVGRIHPVKGLGVLLESIRSCIERIRGLQIVIAGPDDAGHQTYLQRHAIKLGIADRIHWPGVVAGREKWSLLRDADLFTLVSFSENFGLAAVEAMAVGTAVMIGEGVNIAALVQKYNAGWIVPTQETSIRDAICEAFRNPALRATRAEAAKKLVAEQFNPDVNGRRSLKIYSKCLEHDSRRGAEMSVDQDTMELL